jgi:D-beta-D-heptose 7-phosphate kinase/D-beta-D-heptose 1-phosphate adenosyltransferase
MEQWNPEHLLITLGEQGVMLFGKDTQPYHAPTRAREVFDVSGAGDTVIALFTLALSAGIPAPQAAELANHASGVVVGKLGTATVSPEELLASFDS